MKIRLLLFTVLATLFSTCKQGTDITIGFMVPTFDVARYSIDRDNFVARATELGAKVLVENAGNDDKLQMTQASNLIAQGADVLVIISVNQNTAASIVREAKSKNVKVIAYERLIKNSELDYFIAFDHYVVGQEMAKYAMAKKPTGNYVIISGDKTDKNAELINDGNLEMLAGPIKSSKIKLVHNTFIEDWEPEAAYMAMVDIINLSGAEIDVVLSANDGMAGGIVKALTEAGLDGKVLVTGLDAELPACKRIVNGTQAITVYKPLQLQARIAAEVAISLANNKTPDVESITTYNGKIDVPTVSIKPTVVDINNLRQTIVADGFHSEKAIYE